jgi:DNA (cytosine-5)-methyltransferase 1
MFCIPPLFQQAIFLRSFMKQAVHYLKCPACKFPVEVYQGQPCIIKCPGCGKSIYLAADLFCGAGGTSTGAERAVRAQNAEMILVCVNHWPLAIETHQANHPEAMHYLEDITQADPVKIVPWGWLDLLCASPECTHFSRARGGKPVNNQSRMNPWAILTWITKLNVRTVLIENVPEFRDWGPVDANDQPIKEMKGIFFEAWTEAIKRCGYKLEYRILNAADYGDATTRKRFFLIARKDKHKVSFPKPTHSKDGGNGLLKWRAAREIIDWNLTGRSIFDAPKYKKHPLSINTRRRIAAGLRKQNSVLAPYFIRAMELEAETGGSAWPEAFTLQQRAHATPRTMEQPIHAVTASWNGGNTLVNPKVEPFIMANRSNNMPRSLDEPIFTATAENMGNLYAVNPKVDPFTFASRFDNTPHDVKDPIPTITNRKLINLVEAKIDPFIIQNQIRSDGDRVYDIKKPVKTITGHGGGALIEPMIMANRSGNMPRNIEEPIHPITTRGNLFKIEPVILGQQSCSAARTPDKPIPTVATGGAISLTQPELVIFHGTSNTADIDKPLPCQPTKSKLGLSQPQIVKYYGNEREALSVEDPLDTVTTKDRFALAESCVIQIDQKSGTPKSSARPVSDPLATIVTKQNIGLAVAEAVMVPVGHGNKDMPNPRTLDIESPVPAMTTHRHIGLVQPATEAVESADVDPRRLVWIDGVLYKLDILFRMLSNPELAASHSFNEDERKYEFKGTVVEITKQIGNSVPCGIAAALVGEILR